MEIPALNLTVDHETPVAQQKWRKHLIVVSSTPNRFVGLVSTLPEDGKPFVLYAAAMYICNLQLQPMPDGKGARMIPMPHGLIPYDLMELVPEIRVIHYEHIVDTTALPPQMAEWFYGRYLELAAGPAKILTGAINPAEAMRLIPGGNGR
mgnify:CR=1 FL=1